MTPDDTTPERVTPVRPSAIHPGGVLDRNVCQCGHALFLITAVGWVHVVVIPADAPLAPGRRPCETPAPVRMRCAHCRQLVAHFGALGLVAAHPAAHPLGPAGICRGSGQSGLAPMAESAAFTPGPDADTGPGDIT